MVVGLGMHPFAPPSGRYAPLLEEFSPPYKKFAPLLAYRAIVSVLTWDYIRTTKEISISHLSKY